MKNVVILSGVSGSGKSRLAKSLAEQVKPSVIVSADDHFTGSDGQYRFDQTQLSEAHGACFRTYIEALRSDVELVIVDNTNTTEGEIAPYILASQAYHYDARIFTLMCYCDIDIRICAERNTHSVPLGLVCNQAERIWKRNLPGRWAHVIIEVTSDLLDDFKYREYEPLRKSR
jgi:tRNA uridine 5-carbamoylmethylation protein Kti12